MRGVDERSGRGSCDLICRNDMVLTEYAYGGLPGLVALGWELWKLRFLGIVGIE